MVSFVEKYFVPVLDFNIFWQAGQVLDGRLRVKLSIENRLVEASEQR